MFLGFLDLISCADLFIKSLLIFADFSGNGYYDKKVVVELFWTRAKLCFTFFFFFSLIRVFLPTLAMTLRCL